MPLAVSLRGIHCCVAVIDPAWCIGEAMSSEEVGMLRNTAVSMEAGSAHEARAATDASNLPVPPPQASYTVLGFRSKPCSLDSGLVPVHPVLEFPGTEKKSGW